MPWGCLNEISTWFKKSPGATQNVVFPKVRNIFSTRLTQNHIFIAFLKLLQIFLKDYFVGAKCRAKHISAMVTSTFPNILQEQTIIYSARKGR